MNMLRRASSPSRIIALFTLLGMLLAPLCAPVCSLRICADRLTTQSDDCHGSLAATDSGAGSTIAAKRACGSQEFPTANLNEGTNSIERLKQNHTPPDLLAAQTSFGAQSSELYRLPGMASDIVTRLFPPTVLRI